MYMLADWVDIRTGKQVLGQNAWCIVDWSRRR